MKVISQEDIIGQQRDEDAKSRTDVQDILADNEHSRCRVIRDEEPSSGVPVSSGISAVLPGLFLCGAGACRPADLRACGVTCIISAAQELPDTPLPHPDTIFLRVPVMDTVEDDLTPYFDMVADIIEQVKLSGGCTLVHCVAGVSRSAALCLAYLMRERRLPLSEAFHFLRSKRSQVRPNTGFFKQLIKYEQQVFGKTSVNIVFNEAAGREIPDVYEPDYRDMLWYRQRQCITSRY